MKYIDLHCDTLTELKEGETLVRNHKNVDLKSLKKGGCVIQCASIFIPTGTYTGVDRKEPTDNFQVDRPEKLEFMPGVIGALREITGNTDFRLVMVSNQDGLGTADFPMEDFMLPQTLMLKVLESEGIVFDETLLEV